MRCTKWVLFGTMATLSMGSLGACGSDTAQDSEEWADSAASEQRVRHCGGFLGLRCPPAMLCVDDPSDDCNPSQGGRDCIGICIPRHGPRPGCDYRNPLRRYVSRDPDACKAIFFSCDKGRPFFDRCGCGCELSPSGGEQCGRAICRRGEYCCNESCSICAPEGGVCTQQLCE